jgi:hypothetical protein
MVWAASSPAPSDLRPWLLLASAPQLPTDERDEAAEFAEIGCVFLN